MQILVFHFERYFTFPFWKRKYGPYSFVLTLGKSSITACTFVCVWSKLIVTLKRHLYISTKVKKLRGKKRDYKEQKKHLHVNDVETIWLSALLLKV